VELQTDGATAFSQPRNNDDDQRDAFGAWRQANVPLVAQAHELAQSILTVEEEDKHHVGE
jgi:hypothetical protein